MSKQELVYLFHQGTLYKAYDFMGCQYNNGTATFRVWAPHALSVSVVGDFNSWQHDVCKMKKISDGVWEAVVKDVAEYSSYKYYIITADGRALFKSDPYAFHGEPYGEKSSKVVNINNFCWNDAAYIDAAKKRNIRESAMNIYEVHVGSWRKYPDGNFYDYRKFADEIIPYLLDLNYTHIELMGVAEHPFDGSWGYQVTGYFAPTARHGRPEDFAYLINKCHENNIGVIMDWVPGHFPKDANGLYEFDGQPLYEAQGEHRMEHKEWGTRCFDYGRCEVQTFLVSNALYWLDKFHIDGLRVDAVASMLYLDYGRRQYSPNSDGGRENLEAIAFLRKFNAATHQFYSHTITIAEESTAWPLVTRPVDVGGLGFDFKWNMGWMNDNLFYAEKDPVHRQYHHSKLTFSLVYAFSENFILPISHDEVVHGKKSLLAKMPGDIYTKLPQMRAFLANMYAHPGKKLLFSGTEFAQYDEWNFSKGLDFNLLEYDTHKGNFDFCRELFKIYKNTPALYQIEDSWDGFEWLVADAASDNVIVYQRKDKSGNKLIAIINFSSVYYHNYRFGCDSGEYKNILTSHYHGWSTTNDTVLTENIPQGHKQDSISIDIPSFGAIYLYSGAAARAETVAAGAILKTAPKKSRQQKQYLK